MLVAPREGSWIVCVTTDSDLNGVLLQRAAAGGGIALTQHARARHDLCNRSKALLQGLVLVVLDVDLDGAVTLTQALGRGFVIIVALSGVQLDGVVAGLAGAHVQLALRVEGLLGSRTLCTTNGVKLVTDSLLWAFLWLFSLRVDAGLEACAALPHLFLCGLAGLTVHWYLVTGPVLLSHAALATGEETHAKGGPLVKHRLSRLRVRDSMSMMVLCWVSMVVGLAGVVHAWCGGVAVGHAGGG